MGHRLLGIVAFHLVVVGVSWGANPPYFADPINGYFISGLADRDNATLKPGTLSDCKETYTSTSYRGWACVTKDADFTVTTAGNTLKFTFETLHVSESTYKGGVNYWYGFGGPYTEKLPDGTTLTARAGLTFDQSFARPTRVQGKMTLGSLASGAFIAEVPAKPAPPTAP